MGSVQGSNSGVPNDELEAIVATTPFTEPEVERAILRFRELDHRQGSGGRVAKKALLEMSELNANPFAPRLLDMYSSADDGSLDLYEFIDLFATFSKGASGDLKTNAVFAMLDGDGDGFIGRPDVETVVALLITKADDDSEDDQELLDDDEAAQVVTAVLSEGDIDGNEHVSYVEFQKLMQSVPGFADKFTMTLDA